MTRQADEMDRYEMIIYWSNDDHTFVAEVPELAGCFAHGATHEGTLAQVKEAMALWIETAQCAGQLIRQLKGSRLIFA